jgi:hypothetical protein
MCGVAAFTPLCGSNNRPIVTRGTNHYRTKFEQFAVFDEVGEHQAIPPLAENRKKSR